MVAPVIVFVPINMALDAVNVEFGAVALKGPRAYAALDETRMAFDEPRMPIVSRPHL